MNLFNLSNSEKVNSLIKSAIILSIFLFIVVIVAVSFFDKWLVVLFVLFFFGIVLFPVGFKQLYQQKMIVNLPLSKIRSMAMGLVKLKGVVVHKGKLLISPINKQKCVYYNCVVEELVSSGKSSRWVTVFRSTESAPFYIQDETGKVLVDLKGAQIDLKKDTRATAGLFKKIPPNFEEFLKRVNIKSRTILNMPKTMRYREDFLLPNDAIYIVGAAGYATANQMEAIQEFGINQDANPQNNINADTSNNSFAAKLGFITMGYKPEIIALQDEGYSEFRSSFSNTIIQQGSGIYIISDKEESAVIRKLGLSAVFSIILGSCFIVVGLTGILIYFKII